MSRLLTPHQLRTTGLENTGKMHLNRILLKVETASQACDRQEDAQNPAGTFSACYFTFFAAQTEGDLGVRAARQRLSHLGRV